MFTGIVEEIGTVQHVQRANRGYTLTIGCVVVREDTRLGDSVAVNGVCLTVTELAAHHMVVGLSPETRSRTNLASLKPGSSVNLERSVTPTTRMGGHFVQGHVDTTGVITQYQTDADAVWVTVRLDQKYMHYLVPKGFIALDGASLTVVDVGDDWFRIVLIAYTQQHITLPQQPVGYAVNVEVDIVGKYVERMVQHYNGVQQGITFDMLAKYGYM